MAPLAPGDVFAGCRIDAVIGRGGMGVVYRGTELGLDRPVAIKLIAAERAGDASMRRRFEREAKLMAAIDHPNVIPVYAAGEQDGALYLVMRFVDGVDLQQRLRELRRLEPREAARIIDGVARALDAAHQRGLVHRDIKPANVLLAGEHVYLTDFGITRLAGEASQTTETGEWVGTLDFASPEHLRGEPTDARSDVYSLGCLLYACLIGVPPFTRVSPSATITAHLNERPAPLASARPGLPRGLDQVIARALAKNPAHRYAGAGAFGAAAVAAAAGRAPRWGPVERDATVAPAGRPEPPRADGGDRPPTAATVAEASPTRVAVPDAAPTRTLPAASAPTLRLDAPPRRARRRRARERRRRNGAVLGLGVALVGLVLGAFVWLPTPRARPYRPFTGPQITTLARSFAAAYGHRDLRRLRALLAPGVVRVTPTRRETGRAAVLADYAAQFRTRPLPRADRLSGLVVSAGWVGRVAAAYRLTLTGGAAVDGSVILAVQRVGAEPRIGLIATQETGPTSPVSRPRP